jgi:hypothetical protein
LAALLPFAGCVDPPVETPRPKVVQQTSVRIEQNVKNKVDVLFLIDDSPSMTPKQNELRARFPQLIKILENFGQTNPAHYHIGVVTSDLGASSFVLGGGQCKPGGRGGKLQPIGAGAAAGCMGPTGGVNFIDYNQINNTNNLPAGQDLAATFGCMAAVGDRGCGFEHSLEAVYRALHDQPQENHDFLRSDALLVVVFVTDEDDCSGDANTDLFDPAKTNQYGTLLSYRCTQYGIMDANGSLPPYADSGGPIPGPQAATAAKGGKLIEVQKYINFFTKSTAQGGVKVDPLDVILVGITAPSTPVSSLLANPNPMPPGPYVQCPTLMGTTCAVVLQHSCIDQTNTQFFGDPAVRINQVINSVPQENKQLTSICDTSYQSALEGLGQKIISAIGAGCIDSPFEDPANPDCLIEDVTRNADGTTTVKQLPKCASGGTVSAPCWRLESKPLPSPGKPGCTPICAKEGDPGQHYGITICRNSSCSGGDPPANTTARVACATVAVPKDIYTGMLPTCGAPLP